ncbi:DUF3027 domain-containing protein [Kocuria marina]|uniref:DUF3027 domain-containing protein n=1 Tax=Kocuria marina TaxID=223184 RepID=UPI0022DEEA45|nr:DUF3027 domain-containing protein [Kocuria marina]
MSETTASETAASENTASETTAETTPQRPAGRTRTPKQDPILTAAVDLARDAVLAPVTDASSVGEHLGVTVHEDRLLTHLFDCRLAGYPGWTWYATVARAPRSKHVTVCETGLVAGPDSLLAPDWVPWEERMQALQEQEAQDEHDSPTEGDEHPDDGQDSADAEHAGDGDTAPAEETSTEGETPHTGDEPAASEDAEDGAAS